MDLKNVITDLDGGTGDGGPRTIQLGPSMDVHASTVLEGRIVNEDKVALTLEIKVVTTPGGDVRVTTYTRINWSLRRRYNYRNNRLRRRTSGDSDSYGSILSPPVPQG
jgi:hypothetical protein